MAPRRNTSPRTPRLGALGRAIEAEREAAGLSQRELAKRLRIHSTQISALERGQENPGYERLVELAEALGTSIADLAELAEKSLAEDPSGETG
jgi:transcriptional regulator with XRE-family HTH domain